MSHRRILPTVLVALLLLGTLAVAATSLRHERQRADERAAAGAARAVDVTRLGVTNASGSLGNAAGLFDASDEVTSRDFAAFARRVLGRGGLAAVAWMPKVTPSGRAPYEAQAGVPITVPDGAGGTRVAPDGVHYPLTYVTTRLPAAVPLRLDSSADPARGAALRRAALEDTAIATAPLTLLGSGVRGILIYQPVYAGGSAPTGAAARLRALRGFVVGSFPLEVLAARIIDAADAGVPIEIRDGDDVLSAPAPAAAGGARVDVGVAGRRWTILAGRPPTSLTQPVAILTGGVALTLLALLLAVAVARRDRFAVSAVGRATTELRESRRSLRALSDNSPDIVARYDRDLRCTFVNAAVTAATGLPPSAFLGRTSAEAGMPPALVATWEGAMRRAFDGEEGVEVDFAFASPDGPRTFQSRLVAEPGPDGPADHVLVVTRDTTRQTRAEEGRRASEHRYRVLLESLSDGVVVQDATGAIVSCNPAAEAILGISAEGMTGRATTDPRWRAVRDDDTPLPADENPALVTLRTGEPQDGVVLGMHRPDGSLVWLSVSTRPLDDDGSRSVVCCFTDITARVQAGREQDALRRVATVVAGDAEPPEVHELVAREAAAITGAEAAGVVRFDARGLRGVVVGAHARGDDAAATGAAVDLTAPTAIGRVATTGVVARVGDGTAPIPSVIFPGRPVSSAVAAPIRVDNRLWGALSAVTTRPDEPLGPETAERLTRLAELVALAIMSAEARAQMATLASTDHLTGLPNRRAFTDRLAAEIAVARRDGTDVSLVLIDIDHFKRINDTHGHPAGDRVLMGVAAEIFGHVREDETVARIGGEEFAWVLPRTDGADAMDAAERMRHHLGTVAFDDVGTLTLSMGVCELRHARDASDLLRLADVALYRAKDAGRDRVVRHDAAPAATAGAATTSTGP
ncbi:diguanylate cyclase [Miltoncostaea oceani]|uniref:diguanylate cyclase n=1 Tax=Miltoncostaea oceani TaxID=2843216 RepID=UPI001C3DEEF5|nr:diguanylate cyclase [Miltoncostaea oceani]